jgi:catechol 2,3-dioxygenase-like lactoylglutathione lyase family enzyme
MIKGIHHVALAVADLQAAERFYRNAASMMAAVQQPALPLPAGPGASVMLNGANCSLRLLATPLAVPAPRPVSEAGITHFCVQGVDPAALHARFGQAGASFHSDLVDLGTGYLYCYARDPEGNVIEIEGVAPVWDDAAPWFAHAAMSTAQIGPMTDFYAAVLGTAAVRSPRMGKSRRMDRVAALDGVELEAAWIPGANMQVELMQYFQPATVARSQPPAGPGYQYFALEVDDVAAELARLQTLGASVPADLAGHRSDTQAFCADPDGNLLLLLAPDAAHAIDALPDASIVARLNALGSRAKNESHQ